MKSEVLSLEEHRTLGQRLNHFRREASERQVLLDDAYGPNSSIGKAGEAVCQTIQKLTDLLQSRAVSHYGEIAENLYWPNLHWSDCKPREQLEAEHEAAMQSLMSEITK